MYTVTNTYLDKLFEHYKITSFDDLETIPDDDFIDFMKDAKILPVYEVSRVSREDREDPGKTFEGRFVLVRHTSIDRLKAETRVVLFMPIDFWRSEIKAAARQKDIYRRMDSCQSGDEFMSLMLQLKVGVSLLPGESAKVEWTDEFVNEKIKNSPYLTKLKVEKDGVAVERVIPVDEVKKEVSISDIENMDYKTLQGMAKEEGIDFVGVAKTELIKQLVEKRK